MNFFIIALIPPLLWATTNYLDKYLLNRFFKNSIAGPLVLLTATAGFVMMLLIAAIFPDRLGLSSRVHELIMIFSGIMSMTGGIFYVTALSKEDPSIVIPLFQIIPIFNFVLGFVFLHEQLLISQIFASLLIIGGAVAISLDLSGRKLKLKKGVLGIMIISCLIVAFNNLIFKSVVTHENYWGSVFWSYTGYSIFAAFCLTFIKSWRKKFIEIFTQNRSFVIGISVLNEGLNIIAVLIYNFALLILPIAIVSVVGNGLQPFFVLLLGTGLALFLPRLGMEKISRKHLTQKVIAVIIIFIGTYLLNVK